MKEAVRPGLFWRIGRITHRRRRIVLGIWIVLIAAFALLASKTPELLKDNGFTPEGSESDRGLALLQGELGYPPSALQLVYTSDTIDVTNEKAKASIEETLKPLKELPYVTDISFVGSPRTGKVNVQAVNVFLNLTTNNALNAYPELKSKVAVPDGMKVDLTGGTAVLYDMQVASKKDIRKAEAIGLPIALVVLLLVFGTLIGAVLPLVIGLSSVTLTLGIVYFIARDVSLSNFLPNMVSMLGLAVGTDYALFLVSRFREELKRRDLVEDAVAWTIQTAGSSIFFSGIAVLIGLLGMLFIPLSFYRSLCLGGALVVSISVLAGITLLPALLGALGHRINSLRVLPRSWRTEGRFWKRLSYLVMRSPILLVIIVSLGLLAMMQPIGVMKLGIPNAEVLPPSYESRHGADLLKAAYDSRELNPIQIIVRTKTSVFDDASLRDIRGYAEQLRQKPGVRSVSSITDAFDKLPASAGASQKAGTASASSEELRRALQQQLETQKLAKGRSAMLLVIPATAPDQPETDTLVRKLRSVKQDGLDTLVTGGPAYRLDVLDRIQGNTDYVLIFVMLVTYIVLLAAFRSLLLPLKAVLMNVLSLGASMGIVVRVFQYGDLAGPLHITSTGYVSATLPVIIFCVVFGISMDYEVFLISRIAEEYEATGDNERSTAVGLQKTGSLITSAASILIIVVGSFLFTDIEMMKALGLGLGLAVLIDATIVRVALVPALMKLMGRANWWAPGWIKRR